MELIWNIIGLAACVSLVYILINKPKTKMECLPRTENVQSNNINGITHRSIYETSSQKIQIDYTQQLHKMQLEKLLGELKINDLTIKDMNKQEFISVWIDGKLWFDTPVTNQQETEDMLVKKGLSAKCLILPKGETPATPKVKVLTDKQKK